MGYHRSREQRRRLKKLYSKTGGFPGGAWYDEERDRYIRSYTSNHNHPGYSKYLRRVSNRRVRRTKHALQNGQYRKVYDYWYELY